MNILAVFIVFLINARNINGNIQCYKCTLTISSYNKASPGLCSEFDYSDKFIVDCPFSTFCMKKSFTAKIPYPINGTERDCAPQKYVTQSFKDGHWQQEIYIKEPFNESCSFIDDKGVRTSTTEFCYCKGDLCNNSIVYSYSFKLIISVIIIYCIIII